MSKRITITIFSIIFGYLLIFYCLRWFIGGHIIFKSVFYPMAYVSAYRDNSPFTGKKVEGYVIKLSGVYTFYEASSVEDMLADENKYPNHIAPRNGFMYEWVPFVKKDDLVTSLTYTKIDGSHYEYSNERVEVEFQRLLFEENGRYFLISVPLHMEIITD